MAGMLEYKCPCCDGAIQFDSATQKMKCPYCDTEFEVDTLKGYDKELKDEKPSEMEWATPGGSWAEGETAGLHTYSCKSCGGEIVGDDTMAASACPFCGNPIVLTGQFAGALRPDLIIPFKLDKKAAKAKLQEHLKGKTLLPRVFRSQNHIDEIKGVYVPFWLFDSDADAQLRFTATRTRSWSDNKYGRQGGQPILLLCNGSREDTMVTIYCSTGRPLDWTPQLSGSTGQPVLPEGVADFSAGVEPAADH